MTSDRVPAGPMGAGAVGGSPGGRAEWPRLALDDWTGTRETLHLWTQIVGKVRLAHTELTNHWWNTPLYVTVRGLTTSPMPFDRGLFQIDFDFLDHRLQVATSERRSLEIPLYARPVADFYAELMAGLRALGARTDIWTMPVEIPGAVPFDTDTTHGSYDPVAAWTFWRQLVAVNGVLTTFRNRYVGKVSPVHLFWGALDLAVTRFSGRPAPRHPGGAPHLGRWVMEEAYSHEVSSAGFWPGGGGEGAFYSYAYPEPPGFSAAAIGASEAAYRAEAGEFLLPYSAVRTAADPEAVLLVFLQDTYRAAADLGGWDTALLERAAARL